MTTKRKLLSFVFATSLLSLVCEAQPPIGNTCPLEFGSVRWIPPFSVVGQPSALTWPGTLSLKYTNVTGRDILNASVKVSSETVIAGPANPSFVGTTVNLAIPGPIRAGASKRKSLKTALKSSNFHVQVWLTEVAFADGQRWVNSDEQLCVFQSNP